jgi:hypothetical protein
MSTESPESDPLVASGEIIAINPEETSGAAEKEELFGNPDHHAKVLSNQQFRQDMAERKKYADAAFKLTRLWVWFLIGSTAVQMFLSIWGMGLSEAMFITLLTTTTISVLGVWALVGSYLFGKKK